LYRSRNIEAVSHLSLLQLTKRFKDTTAVDGVTLEIQSGEFFSILGPSGCGKTTLLRLVAGFDLPTAGRVLLGDEEITHQPAQSRNIGMVFQNYALFPHMTVSENVAFGLETRKLAREEVRLKVEEILRIVHMGHKADVQVPLLSGGEQQRVAVARALVVEPRVLLFDEPLSNLDVTLRLETREEIRSLQRATGITTLYVTHDQSEAMSLSDRIAVMQSGRIQQVGSPEEIYEHPADSFIAQFVGGATLLKGRLNSATGRLAVGGIEMYLPASLRDRHGGNVTLAVKPEGVRLVGDAEQGDFDGVIRAREYLGYTTRLLLEAGGVEIRVTLPTSEVPEGIDVGDSVRARISWSQTSVFRGWD
jgi:iron(III) transport system ATP-binding protein